jgi:hypothetical protein
VAGASLKGFTCWALLGCEPERENTAVTEGKELCGLLMAPQVLGLHVSAVCGQVGQVAAEYASLYARSRLRLR